MKFSKTKHRITAGMLSTVATLQVLATKIHAEPSFDAGAATSFTNGWTTPLTTFAMGLIPAVTAIGLLFSGLKWMTKDEEEKDQKPFTKTVKTVLIVAVVLESIPILLRIFGIS